MKFTICEDANPVNAPEDRIIDQFCRKNRKNVGQDNRRQFPCKRPEGKETLLSLTINQSQHLTIDEYLRKRLMLAEGVIPHLPDMSLICVGEDPTKSSQQGGW